MNIVEVRFLGVLKINDNNVFTALRRNDFLLQSQKPTATEDGHT